MFIVFTVAGPLIVEKQHPNVTAHGAEYWDQLLYDKELDQMDESYKQELRNNIMILNYIGTTVVWFKFTQTTHR